MLSVFYAAAPHNKSDVYKKKNKACPKLIACELLNTDESINLTDLESAPAQALRTSLRLPHCTPNVAILSEAKAVAPVILKMKETLCMYLRHISRHNHHNVADVAVTRKH